MSKNTLNIFRTTNELILVLLFILDKEHFTFTLTSGGFMHVSHHGYSG